MNLQTLPMEGNVLLIQSKTVATSPEACGLVTSLHAFLLYAPKEELQTLLSYSPEKLLLQESWIHFLQHCFENKTWDDWDSNYWQYDWGNKYGRANQRSNSHTLRSIRGLLAPFCILMMNFSKNEIIPHKILVISNQYEKHKGIIKYEELKFKDLSSERDLIQISSTGNWNGRTHSKCHSTVEHNKYNWPNRY